MSSYGWGRGQFMRTLRLVPITALAVVALMGSFGEPAAGPQATWTSPDGGVRVVLSLDRPEYPFGVPVTLRLSVANLGSAPFSYPFRTGQHYEFEVHRGGVLVWRWSQGRVFIQILTTLTVPPGGKREYTEKWMQVDSFGRQVSPGEYTAIGYLPVDREATAAPVPGRLSVTFQIRRS